MRVPVDAAAAGPNAAGRRGARVALPAMADPPRTRHLFFDAWSRFYDAPWVQRVVYRPVQDAVVEALGAPPERSCSAVLDVGCGTGLLTARLGDELPGATVVGCDLSEGMLRRAAVRRRALLWVQGNALRLPFRDASFDAVISTESFHWFPDQAAALAEFFRVTAPGGRLLVALINPPVEPLSQATRVGSRAAGQPLYWPTRPRMREQVEAAGFRVEGQRRIRRIPAGALFPPVLTVAVRPA